MGEVIKLRVASSQEAITLQSASGSLAVEAVSPRVEFERTPNGSWMNVTDVDGEKTTFIPDGVMGPIGPSGATGPAGIGIVSCELLQDYRLMITYSNGVYDIVGPIRGAQGEIGPIGPSGIQGPSGVGIVYCELLQDYRLQITYSNGTYDIVGPIRGPQGEAGNDGSPGADGTTFTPSVSSDGVLSWTNDGGRANPQSVNIKGPQGDAYVLTAQDKSDIAGMVDASGKADKVSGATAGNFAGLDGNGNLIDSGSKASDFVTGQAFTSALSTKQDVLTDTDKYEIVENALPPFEFPAVAVQTAGRIVNYTTGGVNVRSTCDASVLVDLLGFPVIRYSRVKITNASQAVGIAFYDSAHNFIDEAGIPALFNQSEMGYVLHDVDVPAGAKYARFTMLADTETYGNFELYGISGTFEMLEKKADKTTVETISGTDPVIYGRDNSRYICGTCDTLTLTPPSSGIVDVVFTSGTTPTVLSVPSTVKWPGWFNPANLNANTTYEINIMDGVYGAVTAWT